MTGPSWVMLFWTCPLGERKKKSPSPFGASKPPANHLNYPPTTNQNSSLQNSKTTTEVHTRVEM
ncbi:hypothetical protein CRUP_005910 [Coryphaenoides rupestris]|nr:hypothetical protein CRUP_005910 [Coryphaenoides rupestris]